MPWLLTAAALAVPASPASGQAIALEVRAGLSASTRLAVDRVANPTLRARLGSAFTGEVRAEPAHGVTLALSGATPLRARSELDISLAWTATRLDAVDAAGRREIQPLGTGSAIIGVRYYVTRRIEAGCGFGALRYFATGGLFEGGAELSPVVECGAGVHPVVAGLPLVVRAIGQAHRFRTPVLRDAGAQTGTVYRASLQAGVSFGRRR